MRRRYTELEVGERVLRVDVRGPRWTDENAGEGDFEGVAPELPARIGRLRIEEVMATVRDAADSFRREIGSRVPGLASIELTFGISLEAGADLWIASSKGEANFEIKLVLSTVEPSEND